MGKYKTILLLFLIIQSIFTFSQKQVSIESLMREMVDRDEMARFPTPSFTCKQFSSYDRNTKVKDEDGWFANWDRSHFIDFEKNNDRTEFVMMDAMGPGAIVRFWMTFSGKNSGLGTMRIYIDNMTTPAIEGNAFEILSGNKVADPPLASSVSKLTRYEQRGHNLYFPIPYSKRCKITYQSENILKNDFGAKKEGSERVYYNINYRTYEPDTKVISFSTEQINKNKKLIDEVQAKLSNKKSSISQQKLAKINLNSDLAPGESKSFTVNGPNALKYLGMKLEATNKEQALRSIVLEICFDGQKTVWTPVGDFFGIGYRQIYTNTWYTTAKENGQMDANWVMPFKETCKITLINLGNERIKISNARAEYGKWRWDDKSMYFGCSWHQYSNIHTGGSKNMDGRFGDMIDLNFVMLNGRGVYAGDGISLFNTTYAWWGEGDEKVYVDNEHFPSHIGTGTEDYYGYAWCRPEKFTDHPFIAQPDGSGSFQPGYTTNTRVRSLDKIPFTKSLVFDMELWHWGKGNINYAPITFWYIIPGGSSVIKPDLDGVQEKVALQRSDIVPNKVNIYIEAESMNLVSKDGGKFEYQSVYPEKWSKGLQIYWKNIKQGNKLTIDFESDWDIDCNISAMCTMAKDYGVFDVYLNGIKLKAELNLFSDNLKVKEMKLGYGTLVKGHNQFTFEMVNSALDSKTGCLGIDQFIFH